MSCRASICCSAVARQSNGHDPACRLICHVHHPPPESLTYIVNTAAKSVKSQVVRCSTRIDSTRVNIAVSQRVQATPSRLWMLMAIHHTHATNHMQCNALQGTVACPAICVVLEIVKLIVLQTNVESFKYRDQQVTLTPSTYALQNISRHVAGQVSGCTFADFSHHF